MGITNYFPNTSDPEVLAKWITQVIDAATLLMESHNDNVLLWTLIKNISEQRLHGLEIIPATD